MPWDTKASRALAAMAEETKRTGESAPQGAELLSGVFKVLLEASSALARLGNAGGGSAASGEPSSAPAVQPVDPLGLFQGEGGGREQVPGEAGAKLANAATALAQAAAALKLGQGGAGDAAGSSAPRGVEANYNEDDEPSMSPTEFVEAHNLDPWVAEALEMLSPGQCAAVINPELNLSTARNPNGVVVSRIKQVATVDHRIEMFVRVNELAEGVVDRLSTLSPEQKEAVMESGLKIQKATNPSGVAMKRITEVLKATQPRGRHAAALVPRRDVGHGGGHRGGGGRYNSPGGRRDRGRSYSRGRGRAEASRGGAYTHGGGGGVGGGMPADVQDAMEELGLEQWCGEVLRRLSLWQRQTVIREIGTMRGVRNPSGVVMSRIRSTAKTDELLAIFIDLNGLDHEVESKLWDLNEEQRAEVMAPGIYVQNVRNTSTAVRSRINNVLAGRSAMQRGPRGPPWRKDGRDDRGSGREDRGGHGGRKRGRGSKRGRSGSSSSDDDDDSSHPARRRRKS